MGRTEFGYLFIGLLCLGITIYLAATMGLLTPGVFIFGMIALVALFAFAREQWLGRRVFGDGAQVWFSDEGSNFETTYVSNSDGGVTKVTRRINRE